MIVETSDNRLFFVREIGLPQAWNGIAVKRGKIRGTYERKANAEPQLVRKAGSKVVSQFRLRD